MFRRCFALVLLPLLFLPLPIQSSGDKCPLDLEAASGMIPSDCYANASASAPATTGCCWYVFAAYLLAASRRANLTGEAFMPPAVAASCSSSYSDFLVRRGLVSPSLLKNTSCDLSTSNLAANGGPCQFPTVADVRLATDLSNATLHCASPSAGNLSKDDPAGGPCQTCQNDVISGTLALLNATQTKEFVACGMAATIGIWAPYYPSIPRFRSYALCMLKVLENVGGLGTSNLIPSPPPPPTKPPDVAAGVPSSGNSSTSKTIKVAAASATAGLLSVAAIVYLAFKLRHSTVSPAVAVDRLESSLKPSSPIPSSPLPTDGLYIFTKAELRTATNGYEDRLLLGMGGAGKVYLGRLPSGQCVAIKRIYREKKLAEFYSEVAILAKLRHPNLTTLVGYCLTTGARVSDEREYALVFEYMAGGNLARALFDGEGLPWQRRVQIAADVAEGLAYLHDFPGGTVVHRDVKPTNVLLTAADGAGAAKLSDFGVSRVVSADGTHLSTEVMGTMGYVDPESFAVGHVSEATDVYSFGVVLLELVTGRRAVFQTPTGGSESIVLTARAATEAPDDGGEGGLGAIVDPRLGRGWDRGTVTAVFELACRCVRPHKADRPRMVEAVTVLRAALAELEAPTGTSTSTSEEVAWGEVDSSPA